MEITLTTSDADRVLRVLRKQYQEVMTKKSEHESMLQKYREKENDPHLGDIINIFKTKAQENGINVDFDQKFIDDVSNDIAECDAKLSEIEYAILVMTAGSSKNI